MKQIPALGHGNITKLFIRLVIPAVISQLVTLAYNIVDRIYIGHMPGAGKLALTGVGVCMPVTIILSAFAQLVGFGGASRASAALGAHQPDAAEKTLGTCALFSLCLSIVLTILTRTFLCRLPKSLGPTQKHFPMPSPTSIFMSSALFLLSLAPDWRSLSPPRDIPRSV